MILELPNAVASPALITKALDREHSALTDALHKLGAAYVRCREAADRGIWLGLGPTDPDMRPPVRVLLAAGDSLAKAVKLFRRMLEDDERPEVYRLRHEFADQTSHLNAMARQIEKYLPPKEDQ